jgi:hypothetical protein
LVTRTPAGVFTVFRVPSVADTIWRPIVLRRVSARCRLARVSMKTPPSSSKGFEKMVIGTGPSPMSSRNHFLSGLRLPSVMFISRGASTASASSFGGMT